MANGGAVSAMALLAEALLNIVANKLMVIRKERFVKVCVIVKYSIIRRKNSLFYIIYVPASFLPHSIKPGLQTHELLYIVIDNFNL